MLNLTSATVADSIYIYGSSLILYLCLMFTGHRQLTHDGFLSVHFVITFVSTLISFRVQLFLLDQLRYRVIVYNGELLKALRTNQAADLFNQPSELCDQIFKSMTNNVINCECMDIYDKTLNLQNDSNFMILMHLNIRSLQKNYDD